MNGMVVTLSVVPYDPAWKQAYAAEAARISAALRDAHAEVHHIGSTAIPGIYAKPIIDILLVVPSLESLDARANAMVELGYEALGEFGIAGRRYFRKNNKNGMRTHQVHAFQRGTDGEKRHLAFRDYMNAHPQAAQQYSQLKQRLAIACAGSIQDYMDGKDSFVKHHEAAALAWVSSATRDA